MKCRECQKKIYEVSLLDGVEYHICAACGHCFEIDLNPAVLSIEIMHRKARSGDGLTICESYSSDFVINGNSLLNIIVKAEGGSRDYLGCFARGWDRLNAHSRKQLLLIDAPETVSGRSLIYVCSQCADIGCGAFSCKITKNDEAYIWSDFAYENGYEEPQEIESVGPFVFLVSEYENIIAQAYKL